MEKAVDVTGMDYVQYRQLVEEKWNAGEATGENHSESMLNFTLMNMQRMKRWDKTAKLSDVMLERVGNLKKRYLWVVLTEGWCGDAAHNIPVLAKIAEASENIELRLILRDKYLNIMDKHLTNGGRSIPKLIATDKTTGDELGNWGPRPEPAQKLMLDYKKDPSPDKLSYSEFAKQIQLWYARDKAATIQNEFMGLLNKWEGE